MTKTYGDILSNLIRWIFTRAFGETSMTDTRAFIDDDANLRTYDGTFVGSYARRRDAVRGAKRRGLVLA